MDTRDTVGTNAQSYNVFGGRKNRFMLAGILLVVALGLGLLAIIWPWPYPVVQGICRFLAFMFGGAFFLSVIFAMMGRASS